MLSAVCEDLESAGAVPGSMSLPIGGSEHKSPEV